MTAGLRPSTINDYALGIFDGPHATPTECSEGPVFLGIKNITPDGRLDLSEIRHVTEQEFPKWTRRVTPQPGDVVFTYEATLHRYAMIPEGFRGCLGRRVALVRPDPERLDSAFLLYYFLSPAWRAIMQEHVITGATVDRIPLERFPSFPVAFPPLPTQQRIASILSAYDDLIENNRRRMVLLEDAARQLYQEWFVRLRFPGREHTRIVDGVPNGWRRTTLQEFVAAGAVQLQTGPFGTQLKASDYVEDGTPVVNVRNIGMGTIRVDKLEYVDEITVGRLSAHVLRQGDIVFARKGAVERHVLVDVSQDGWLQGSDCIRLRSTSQVVPALLLSFALREPAHQEWILTQCSNKATMPSLNQDVIGRIPILLSPHALVEQFRLFAAPITEQIGTLARLSAKLRTARDLLLPRLMRGELLP